MKAILPFAVVASLALGCQQRPADDAGASPPPVAAAGEAGTATPPPGHPPLASPGGQVAAPVDPAAAISGQVVIAPAPASRVGGAQALFLIARDPASGQIVAVRKEDGVRLPFPFTISGSDSMLQGGASFAGALDVTARLSKTGDAIAAAGDLEGTAKSVKVGTKGVTLTLDEVRP